LDIWEPLGPLNSLGKEEPAPSFPAETGAITADPKKSCKMFEQRQPPSAPSAPRPRLQGTGKDGLIPWVTGVRFFSLAESFSAFQLQQYQRSTLWRMLVSMYSKVTTCTLMGAMMAFVCLLRSLPNIFDSSFAEETPNRTLTVVLMHILCLLYGSLAFGRYIGVVL
jgi:hypothetical protein